MFKYDYVYPFLLNQTKTLSNSVFLDGKPLGVKTYSNCYALPAKHLKNANGEDCLAGGLCCDGQWVYNSGLNYNGLTPYEFDCDKAEYVDDDVVYLGVLSSIWGHAITDGIQHLWWFFSEEYRNNHRNKKIYYWGDHPLSGNFLEIVRLSGVEIMNLQFVNRILLFRSVIVPDSSFVTNYPKMYYHLEYLRTIDIIVANCACKKQKIEKVFLSEPSSKRNWGVSQIEKIARKVGYYVIHPANFSLQEQISLLQGAKDVMVFDSSVGHNVVFCKPGTRVTVLRKANYVNLYQTLINGMRDCEVRIVDVHLSLMNNERFPYAGPFFLYANDNLCNCLNIPRPSFPWALFKGYLRYCLYDDYQNLLVKLRIPDGYYSLLAQEVDAERSDCYNKVSFYCKCLPLPNGLKQKIVNKIVKVRIQHLL